MFWKYFKKNFFSLNMDAWSDGQTDSKLWLCQELERVYEEKKFCVDTVWIYGSWYGTLAYLLLSRERLPIKRLRCFDIDGSANKIAAKILNHWIFRGFDLRIIKQDCTRLDRNHPHYLEASPNLVINTSCEHMPGYGWWKKIPSGVTIVAQSTDMVHATHINSAKNMDDFRVHFAEGGHFFFEGKRYFNYPNLKFERFMCIVQKK